MELQLQVTETGDRMLYEFHHSQASRHPGSVRATYVLDGVPRITKDLGAHVAQHDGDDVHMQSSPYMNSSMQQREAEENETPQRSVMLAREDDLHSKISI